MRAFEYRVLELSNDEHESQEQLDEAGADGWELVAVVDTSHAPHAKYQRAYLKREKVRTGS